jgi:hypothetical protein
MEKYLRCFDRPAQNIMRQNIPWLAEGYFIRSAAMGLKE